MLTGIDFQFEIVDLTESPFKSEFGLPVGGNFRQRNFAITGDGDQSLDVGPRQNEVPIRRVVLYNLGMFRLCCFNGAFLKAGILNDLTDNLMVGFIPIDHAFASVGQFNGRIFHFNNQHRAAPGGLQPMAYHRPFEYSFIRRSLVAQFDLYFFARHKKIGVADRKISLGRITVNQHQLGFRYPVDLLDDIK